MLPFFSINFKKRLVKILELLKLSNVKLSLSVGNILTYARK